MAVVLFVAFFGTELLFKAVDPFGLHHATVRHSNEMSARTLAPFYHSQAQDRIVVVLIDDATLGARGLSWPPPHAYYAEMLRRILRGQPRAVYVDLLTVDARGTAADLAAARENIGAEIAASGVPVIFAQATPDTPGVLAGVPGLRFATAGWQRAGDAYPVSIARGQVLGTPEDVDATCDPATAQPSVALALYDEACRAPTDGGALPVGCSEPASALRDRCLPAWVVWGLRAPSPLAGVPRVADCDPARTADDDLTLLRRMVWRDLWSGFNPEAFERNRERCPFTLTIPEQALDRDTIPLLRDRIVLVGANLPGLDDSVASPVHSRLPGVYLHAMALDNLMHYGNAHPRPAKGGLLEDLLIAFGAALLLSWILRAGRSRLVTWSGIVVVAFVMAVVPGVFGLFVLHRAPPNWLGMMFVLLGVALHARHKMRKRTKEGA